MNLDKIKATLEAINSKLFPVVDVELAEEEAEKEAEPKAEEPKEDEKSELEQMQEEMIKLGELVAVLAERVSVLEGGNEAKEEEVAELKAQLSALENEPAEAKVALSVQAEKPLSKAQKHLKMRGII